MTTPRSTRPSPTRRPARRTATAALVLGCTHYELVADRIRAAVAPTAAAHLTLHGSADAVVAQALRRVADPTRRGTGTLTVLHAGRSAALPPAVLLYPQGLDLTAPAA